MNQHGERLQLLKHNGFDPRVIYDVGAFRGEWSDHIHQIFPKSDFFLFETNKNNESYLKNLKFSYFIELLGNENKTAVFYSDAQTRKIELQMTTLDSVVKKNGIPLPDLIKIDAQGAENMIMEGSQAIVRHAEVIILETKILEHNEKNHLIYETLDLMHALGYQMSDIIEHNYIHSLELNEVCILFIKNESKLIKL